MKLAAIAALAAALSVVTAATATEPARVALVRQAGVDAVAREVGTRLLAELSAAGFSVIVVGPDAGASEPSSTVATINVVGAGDGAAPSVWITHHVSRRTRVLRIEIGATPESSTPAALAIRTVELLRAGLQDAHADAATNVAPIHAERTEAEAHADRAPRPLRRALLEGSRFEAGLTAIYGLGDATGRVAPNLRYSYGAPFGLAGRVTIMGPTATDQLAVLEAVWGFNRSWRVIVPVVSAGAGALHSHLDDTVNPKHPMLRNDAWAAVFAASAGVAARALETVSVLLDAHALLLEPGAGAVLGGMPAGGQPKLTGTVSLGVLAGF